MPGWSWCSWNALMPGSECPYFRGLVLGTPGSIHCWFYVKALYDFALSACVSWLALSKHSVCSVIKCFPRGYMFATGTSFSKLGFRLSPETLAKEEEKKKSYPWAPEESRFQQEILGLWNFCLHESYVQCKSFLSSDLRNIPQSLPAEQVVVFTDNKCWFINAGVWRGGRRNWACTKNLKAGAEKNHYL